MANKMEKSHNGLIKGDPELKLPKISSPEVRSTYFEPPIHLDKLVRNFIAEIRELANVPDKELSTKNPHFKTILTLSKTQLLNSLDTVVNQYQKNSESYTAKLKRLQFQITTAALFVLLLMAFFIFMPMLRRTKMDAHRLVKSEERYRTLFKKMLNGFAYHKIILDENNKPVDYVFLEINDAFEKLTGLERENIIGKKVTEVIPGIKTSKPDLIKIYGNVALTGEDAHLSIYFEPFEHWYDISAYSPEKGYFVAVFEDITERKKTEDENRKYAHIVSVAEEHMSFLDRDYIYRAVNDAYLNAHRKTREEIIGHSVAELLGEDVFDRLIVARIDMALAGETVQYKSWFDFTGLGRRYMEVYYYPYFEEDKTISGVVVSSRDITEQMKADEKLKEAKEIAESASRIKSDFLASMSHEIRTPMNIIVGMIDILSETELTLEQEKRIHTLSRSCDILLQLINNILDLSKIEAGHIELDETPFNLETLLAEIESVMCVETLKKDLKLSVHIEPDKYETLSGDVKCLRQVLLNLVSNAIKFTEKGRIDINVSEIKVSGDIVELEFCIKDTGIGIQENKLDVIFDKFTQSDSSTSRQYGGTGLGTTIAKMFVEKMGGRIWAESKLGEGSSFFFTAPLKRVESATDEKFIKIMAEEKIKLVDWPVKILIAEDSEDNLNLIRLYLKKTPYIIDSAANGKIAVEKFRSGKYDIVLMDMEMPIMDGYKATKEIRKWEKKEKKAATPIVALTAHALKEYEKKSINAGCTAHVSKPIKKKKLLNIIYEYANDLS